MKKKRKKKESLAFQDFSGALGHIEKPFEIIHLVRMRNFPKN